MIRTRVSASQHSESKLRMKLRRLEAWPSASPTSSAHQLQSAEAGLSCKAPGSLLTVTKHEHRNPEVCPGTQDPILAVLCLPSVAMGLQVLTEALVSDSRLQDPASPRRCCTPHA